MKPKASDRKGRKGRKGCKGSKGAHGRVVVLWDVVVGGGSDDEGVGGGVEVQVGAVAG